MVGMVFKHQLAMGFPNLVFAGAWLKPEYVVRLFDRHDAPILRGVRLAVATSAAPSTPFSTVYPVEIRFKDRGRLGIFDSALLQQNYQIGQRKLAELTAIK